MFWFYRVVTWVLQWCYGVLYVWYRDVNDVSQNVTDLLLVVFRGVTWVPLSDADTGICALKN